MKGQARGRPLRDQAWERSIEVLRGSLCPHGFLASRQGGDNYHAVWGRDGSICANAAFLTDEEDLLEGGIQTLLSLAAHQARNGQIPSYLMIEDNAVVEVVHGGRGNVTTIDSNLWFLIACKTAYDELDREEFVADNLLEVYDRTLRHLSSIDVDSCGLLEIPVGGDWSDILDRSYHVLYDEVLWFRALQCGAELMRACGRSADAKDLEQRSGLVRRRLNEEFWWDREGRERAQDRYLIGTRLPIDEELTYYQSHLQPFTHTWHRSFDAFGNLLACLMGVAPPERCEQVMQLILERGLNQPYPVRVLDPPVKPGDEEWLTIYERKEPPFEYHNGGSWPLAGGWWVVLLASLGRDREAVHEMDSLARALSAGSDGGWGFHEYFHGSTGEPLGRRSQAWSAAAYVFASRAVTEGRMACFERRDS